MTSKLALMIGVAEEGKKAIEKILKREVKWDEDLDKALSEALDDKH